MHSISFSTEAQALEYIAECKATGKIGCCLVRYSDSWFEVRTWDL